MSSQNASRRFQAAGRVPCLLKHENHEFPGIALHCQLVCVSLQNALVRQLEQFGRLRGQARDAISLRFFRFARTFRLLGFCPSPRTSNSRVRNSLVNARRRRRLYQKTSVAARCVIADSPKHLTLRRDEILAIAHRLCMHKYETHINEMVFPRCD